MFVHVHMCVCILVCVGTYMGECIYVCVCITKVLLSNIIVLLKVTRDACTCEVLKFILGAFLSCSPCFFFLLRQGLSLNQEFANSGYSSSLACPKEPLSLPPESCD